MSDGTEVQHRHPHRRSQWLGVPQAVSQGVEDPDLREPEGWRRHSRTERTWTFLTPTHGMGDEFMDSCDGEIWGLE